MLLGVAAVIVLLSPWLFSYPGGPPVEDGQFATVLASWAAWAVIALWWLLSLGRLAFRRKTARRQVRLVVAGGLLVAVGLAAFLGGTMRIRFELSRGALERFARTASRDAPARLGLYHVKRVGGGSGEPVMLMTNSCGLSSECGFVYSPRARPANVCSNSGGTVYSHLSGPWYTVKMGLEATCD